MTDIDEQLTDAVEKLSFAVASGHVRGLVITTLLTDGGVGTTRVNGNSDYLRMLGALDLSKKVLLTVVDDPKKEQN